MISVVFQRFRLLVQELGAVTAFFYVLDRSLRGIDSRHRLYYYRFMTQPLADHPRLPPARGKAFSFRLLKAYEPILSGLDRPLAVIHERLAQGAQCLVAIRNDALVGCIWFVRNAYAEDEASVDYLLPEDGRCVWDFDVFVAEPERLGFLFAKQWDAFDELLKPQGVRYTVSRINAFNQRSIASHRSLGARNCGWALFLKLGSIQAMLSSEKPFVAIGGRPALRIGPKEESTR